MEKPKKQVVLDLTTVDGNAWAIMGAFQQAACRQGWSKEEIGKVLVEARKSDYNHLLATITSYCTPDDPEMGEGILDDDEYDTFDMGNDPY